MRKFQQIHRTTKPTGDPNLPHEVEWALNIKEAMSEKADGTTGSVHDDKRFDDKDDDVNIDFDGVLEEEVATSAAAAVPNPDAAATPDWSPATAAAPTAAPVAAPCWSPDTLPMTSQQFNHQLQGRRGE